MQQLLRYVGIKCAIDNASLSFSASSLGKASLITLGAPSTNSLASFNPKPDGAPKVIKEALPKEEAEKLKEALEEVGATVELKYFNFR
jgi:hypothetical protein